jgi:2-oxoglutarate dehydrogenase E2 component (dihydrolipoamide succinyltransferase)
MIDVVMPQMGESIVEGTLTKWLKKAGETVGRDEPLFEISTDKVDTEIPSPVAGVLAEILIEEGKTVGINTVVARINDGSATAAPAPARQAEAPVPPAAPAPPPPAPVAAADGTPEPVATVVEETAGPLSPLVRKMARENNIDLSQVKGTGAGNRITKQDLDAYLAGKSAPTPAATPVRQAEAPAPPPAPAPQPQAPPPPPPPPQQQSVATIPQTVEVPSPPRAGEAPGTRVEPMSMMRQSIAKHMVFSKQTSAHVTTVHKVDFTKVSKARDKAKGNVQAQYGFSLTFLPFVLKATCVALRQFPILNASIDGTNIIYYRDINLGIAVALENGLIVPVIRNADEKSVIGLQRSVADLAARARSRHLRPEEVQGGTFSITNFGSFGSVFATPVINQPQVAVLGVGTVEKAAVVIDDAIAIRSIAYLALTFDHRLIDGALADQFTGKIKSVLEGWSEEIS